MKKYILLLIVPLLFSCGGGDEKKTWEDFFVSICNDSFSNQPNMNHFKNDNSQQVCECMAKKIREVFNAQEFEKLENDAMSMFDKLEEQALYIFQNPKIQSIAYQCFEFAEMDNKSYIDLNPEKLGVFIEQCKIDFWIGFSEAEVKDLSPVIDLDGYCDCYIKKKLVEFNVAELMDLVYFRTNAENYAENLSRYNEITEECIELYLLY